MKYKTKPETVAGHDCEYLCGYFCDDFGRRTSEFALHAGDQMIK